MKHAGGFECGAIIPEQSRVRTRPRPTRKLTGRLSPLLRNQRRCEGNLPRRLRRGSEKSWRDGDPLGSASPRRPPRMTVAVVQGITWDRCKA